MKLLMVLSFVMALTIGPILFVVRLLYKGKRAIFTVPLTVLVVWGALMVNNVERVDDTNQSATARAPQPAAARPAAEANASAPIRGTVVKQNQDLWFVRIDEPTDEPTFIALRICGSTPDAPATHIAPQDRVLLLSPARQGDNTTLTIQDAQHPDTTYAAATTHCLSDAESATQHGA